MARNPRTPADPAPPRHLVAVLPEVPAPTEGEYKIKESMPVPPLHQEAPLIEDGQPLPAQPATAYRRKVRTVPAEPTATTADGEAFWPVWQDAETGEFIHPDEAKDLVLNEVAVVDTPSDEVSKIVSTLWRQAKLLGEFEAKRVYTAPAQAAFSVLRRQRRERLAQILASAPQPTEFDPEGGVQPVPSEAMLIPAAEVAEIFGKDLKWLRRNSGRNGFPKFVQVGGARFYRSDQLAKALGGA